MSVGERIKKRRKELKMSVDQLAEKLGKNRATVYRYEGDEIDNMPLSVLEPLAEALQVSEAYLMGWEEIKETPKNQPYYALNEKDERDIAKMLQEMMDGLGSGNQAFSFMGEPMDEEDRELLRISLENTLRMSKQMAKKKFTPKKYRDEE